MAKKITENRNKDILIFLTIICLLLSFTINNSIYYQKFKEVKKEQENLEVELTLKKNNIKKINDENNLLTKENNFLTEGNTNIDNIKNTYYQKLKVLEDQVASGKSNYKIAYLTFDDGPYYLTYDFLNTLDKYDILATFFTIGLDKEVCYDNQTKTCSNIYQDIASKGHTMANHTYSHAIFYGLYNSPDTFIDNVIKQEELIKEKTGLTTNIVRFPGGSSTAKENKDAIISRLRERGYGWVDWTAQDGDGGDIKDANKAWNIFTNSIDEDIEVILFHDYNRVTLSLLPDIIKYLEEKNYVLLPLFKESKMVHK